MNDQIILTPEGENKLKDELFQLKSVKRKEIAERIELAKEHGDLSENAEYHEARNEQSFMEGRILEIENLLKNGIIVENKDSNQVQVGSKVLVEQNGNENEFTIVGSQESNPTQGSISCDSPIGEAIIGKEVGEQVEVITPRGLVNYKIKKIE